MARDGGQMGLLLGRMGDKKPIPAQKKTDMTREKQASFYILNRYYDITIEDCQKQRDYRK